MARILAVKLALGVTKEVTSLASQPVEKPVEVHSTSEYQDSLTAVTESLVLLKNEANAVPFDMSSIEYVVLVGEKIFGTSFGD